MCGNFSVFIVGSRSVLSKMRSHAVVHIIIVHAVHVYMCTRLLRHTINSGYGPTVAHDDELWARNFSFFT